jgi:D-galactarolactone cycloisomerase
VQVYASGLNPTEPEKLALQKARRGLSRVQAQGRLRRRARPGQPARLRDALGSEATMMVDANQAWDFDEARAAGERMEDFDLLWLEEPLRADQPSQRWKELAERQPLTLAGGENLAGFAQYRDFIATEGMSVIQPDLGKWGGFSGCLEVAKQTLAAGKWYCPHWLGGGIGLVASMHLKTAVGGAGYVEVDSATRTRCASCSRCPTSR